MPTLLVSVPLSTETHQTLVRAARKLARLLRPQAGPGVTELIQHELTGRSVKGLVDEYLDAIGWSSPVRIRLRRSSKRPHKRTARWNSRTPQRRGGRKRS